MLTLLLRESKSQVFLSMVEFSVVQMPLAASNVGLLAVTVVHSKATGMLEEKARKGLIKYMINMCTSKRCHGLGQ